MKPYEDEKPPDRFEEYYKRILNDNRFKHIPREVFRQWIHELHQDEYTIKNYAWLDYETIDFDLCLWSLNNLSKINVIENFRDSVFNVTGLTDYSNFSCIPEDLDYWIQQGTWRVPPIIIDWQSITSEIPNWCEWHPQYQLVEGHSRFRYLNAAREISKLNKGIIASQHSIYLMKAKNAKAKQF
jgi:hypothetical protein